MLARETKFEALWQEGALELRESGSERVWSRGRVFGRESARAANLWEHVATRRRSTELVALHARAYK